MEQIRFTHLQAPSVVSKTFKLSKEGGLEKKTAPMPYGGLLTVQSVTSLEKLEDYLSGLSPNECLI